jgi:hypothetical protein
LSILAGTFTEKLDQPFLTFLRKRQAFTIASGPHINNQIPEILGFWGWPVI